MWFNIVISKLIIQQEPGVLRKNKFLSYLNVMLEPVNSIYYWLKDYRDLIAYETSITGQVIYLEKLLNDRFSPQAAAPIYITDENYTENAYAFTKAEGIIDSYDFTYAEANGDYFFIKDEAVFNNFIVNIPQTTYNLLIANNNKLLNQLKATLNRYKMTGSIYKIQAI